MPGWTRKLDTGKTQACWRDPAGRQRTATFRNATQAKAHLRKVDMEMEQGTYVDAAGPRTLVSAWVAQWRPTRGGRAPGTLNKIDGHLRVHILPRWGDIRLGDIRPMQVKTWVVEMGKTLAPSTTRDIYTLFKTILAGAVEERLIPSSPASLRPADLPRVPKGQELYLSAEQGWALIAATPEHYRALVHTALWTGMRWSELAGLPWSQVDLKAGTVTVMQAAVEVASKVHIGPPKNEASRRTIHLDPDTVRVLRRHKLARGKGAEYVFTTQGGALLSRTAFRNNVWAPRTYVSGTRTPGAVEAAGLPSSLTFHDLRHSHASLMIAAGMNILTLARRLGHSKPSMTLDRYGHLQHDHVEATMVAIERARLT